MCQFPLLLLLPHYWAFFHFKNPFISRHFGPNPLGALLRLPFGLEIALVLEESSIEWGHFFLSVADGTMRLPLFVHYSFHRLLFCLYFLTTLGHSKLE
jgi:hypothetical protein